MTGLNRQADRLEFVVMYPTSKSHIGTSCCDTHPAKFLEYDGGGDSQGLAALTKWATEKYNADLKKVATIGVLSRAMEVNALAATHPDVFKAAGSYSGAPTTCRSGSPISNPMSSDLSCPLGEEASTYTAEQ